MHGSLTVGVSRLVFCNGDPMRSIVVSSEGAGYGFLVDEEGRLRQAGFGPDIEPHMERLSARVPAHLYPLAYPAYDEEPVRAPALRVTHSGGGTTTRLRVEDVRVAGPATEILLVDPDRPLEVRLCFRAEDHGVLRQWATLTNHQPGAVTLFEVAAASPLFATPAPYLTHFGGGDWARRVDHDHGAADTRDQARRVARRRPAPPPVLPFLPPRSGRRAARGTRHRRGRGVGLGRQHALRLRAHHRPHRAGLVRAQPGGGRVRARPRGDVHHARADLGLVRATASGP